MSVQRFENERWARDDQALLFRHQAALALVADAHRAGAHSVLDVGCGDGLLLSRLATNGMTVVGVDISEKGIEKARAKGLDARLYDVDSPLPFPDNSFDIVILLDVLEHLYTPERLLREASRVSKRWVIVGVPNFSSLAARLQVLGGRVPENNHPHKGHIYWFNESVLTAMLRREHLAIKTMRTNTFFEDQPLLGPVVRLLAQRAPSVFALSFVALLEKT